MRGLRGEFAHKIDAKGRVTLPSSFRKVLPKDLVVTESPAGDCLYVFDSEGFDDWVDSLFVSEGGYDTANENHVNIRLKLNSKARSVDVDSANRITLPAKQCESVGLKKDVVLVGNSEYFLIWDAKRWHDFSEKVDEASIMKKK